MDAEWELLRSVLPTGLQVPVRGNDRWIMDGSWARIIRDLQQFAGSDGGDEDGGGGRYLGGPAGGADDRLPGGAGRSLAVRLSPGQAADCTHAPALLAGLAAGTRVIADRDHDSDAILDLVAEDVGAAVIPSSANRKVPRELDRDPYAKRNFVERFFGKIKVFRRVETRYEKPARNYLSTVLLAETRDLLRALARRSMESTP